MGYVPRYRTQLVSAMVFGLLAWIDMKLGGSSNFYTLKIGVCLCITLFGMDILAECSLLIKLEINES